MADQTSSTQAASQSEAAQASTSATKDSASGTAPTMSTSINSMADLQNKAPEVYHQMLLSLGMTICNRMKDGQDRIKELNRKARNGEA
jgi:hypothetical protein